MGFRLCKLAWVLVAVYKLTIGWCQYAIKSGACKSVIIYNKSEFTWNINWIVYKTFDLKPMGTDAWCFNAYDKKKTLSISYFVIKNYFTTKTAIFAEMIKFEQGSKNLKIDWMLSFLKLLSSSHVVCEN